MNSFASLISIAILLLFSAPLSAHAQFWDCGPSINPVHPIVAEINRLLRENPKPITRGREAGSQEVFCVQADSDSLIVYGSVPVRGQEIQNSQTYYTLRYAARYDELVEPFELRVGPFETRVSFTVRCTEDPVYGDACVRRSESGTSSRGTNDRLRIIMALNRTANRRVEQLLQRLVERVGMSP